MMSNSESKLESDAAPPTEAGAASVHAPYAYCTQILEAAQHAASLHQFYLAFLRIIIRALGSPFASLELGIGSEVFSEDVHDGSTDPKFWKAHLRSFLTESLACDTPRAKLLNPKRGSTKLAFISCPVYGHGRERVGAIAAIVPCESANEVPHYSDRLVGLAEFASGAAPLVHPSQHKPPSPTSHRSLGRIGQVTTPHELAFSLTNSLRNKLGCEQVALAFIRRNRARILSISGQDHVSHQSVGVRCIIAAMEECFDAKEPIIAAGLQTRTLDHTVNFRLHQEWQTAANGDTVASIPLRQNDRILAVISIRYRAGESVTQQQLAEVQERVEAYVPALVLARRASRGLLRHALDNVTETTAMLLARGYWGRKVMACAMIVFVTWCALGRMNHTITVPCTLAPASSRHIAAPFDGRIAAVHVKPGDIVTAGQVLAQFDQRELLQHRAALTAEINVLDTKYDRALAANDPVEARLLQVNRKLLQTRLEMLDTRIEQADIRAPIDGIVVNGDLEDQIGNILERGHPLFRIAPPEQWNVVLRIPESDATHVADGATGVFVPYARPENAEPINVTRIRPTAEVHNEKNVIIAEARGDLPFEWLRPGMEGTARIDAGRKPVWWVMFHEIIDSLRVRFWL